MSATGSVREKKGKEVAWGATGGTRQFLAAKSGQPHPVLGRSGLFQLSEPAAAVIVRSRRTSPAMAAIPAQKRGALRATEDRQRLSVVRLSKRAHAGVACRAACWAGMNRSRGRCSRRRNPGGNSCRRGGWSLGAPRAPCPKVGRGRRLRRRTGRRFGQTAGCAGAIIISASVRC